MAEGFKKVADTGELLPGEIKAVDFGDEPVLLANVEGQYVAVSDTCTHAMASLSMGDLSGETVECPVHGSMFNVKTGESLGPPADESLTVYPVKVEGNDILIGPPG